jgi:hypothetical protein
MRIQKMRLVRFLPCLTVLAVAGCGPGSGSVSGKVTYKGTPLPGGTVTFMTSDQKVKTAIIGSDGTYSIDKVTTGPAKIAVTPLVPLPPMMPGGMAMDPGKVDAPEGDAAAPPAADKSASIPEHYKDPEKSGLTHTVTTGKQEHNIELK